MTRELLEHQRTKWRYAKARLSVKCLNVSLARRRLRIVKHFCKFAAKMSSSPRVRKVPPRPKIMLPIPGQYYAQPGTGMGYVSTPYGQTPMPMTPVTGQSQMIYTKRASKFVFSQFKGIKDLTKSGLSVGEKSAFWLYEKVRMWKKAILSPLFISSS